MSHSDNLAIYISSYDGAADTWGPFFNYFFRHWADCPYPIFLGTNEKSFVHDRVQCLAAPARLAWSKHTRIHLEQIPHAYVLFSLDDFFLKHPMSTAAINKLVHNMMTLDLSAIRIVTSDTLPTQPVNGYPNLGFFPPWQQLRTSCSPTIWRRQDLLSLMRDEENIWQFEINSAVRSHKFNGVCGVWSPVWQHHHAIAQGKWFPWIMHHMKRDGVSFDSTVRATHTYLSAWRDLINVHLNPFVRKILPHRFRQRLRPFILGKPPGS